MIDMRELTSDFPPSEDRGEVNIAVFQPYRTSVIEKEVFLKNSECRFSTVVESIIPGLAEGSDRFVHKGSIRCVRSWSNPKSHLYVEEYIPCDHIVCPGYLLPHHREQSRGLINSLTCSSSECGMHLKVEMDTKEFAETMFHLLLKQMNPSLPSCQYIDCAKAPPDFKGEHPWSEELRKLGVVAFHPKLKGKAMPSPEVNRFYRFGLILFPGMNTTQSCDGFDNWLRFLQTTHQQMIKKELSRLSNSGLGPRPETGSLTIVR